MKERSSLPLAKSRSFKLYDKAKNLEAICIENIEKLLNNENIDPKNIYSIGISLHKLEEIDDNAETLDKFCSTQKSSLPATPVQFSSPNKTQNSILTCEAFANSAQESFILDDSQFEPDLHISIPKIEESIETHITCDECSKEVDIKQYQEHKDFHYAEILYLNEKLQYKQDDKINSFGLKQAPRKKKKK